MQTAKTNDRIKGIDLANNNLVAIFYEANAAHLSSEAVNQSVIVKFQGQNQAATINNGIPHNENKYLIYNERNKNSCKIKTFLYKGISEKGIFCSVCTKS